MICHPIGEAWRVWALTLSMSISVGCQPADPCAPRVLGLIAQQKAAHDEVMSLTLDTSFDSPECDLTVSDTGMVEVDVRSSWSLYSLLYHSYGGTCGLTVEKPGVALKVLRYCGDVHVGPEPTRQSGQGVEVVDLELEFNGEMYVPSLGWNAARQVFCREANVGDELWVVCDPVEIATEADLDAGSNTDGW